MLLTARRVLSALAIASTPGCSATPTPAASTPVPNAPLPRTFSAVAEDIVVRTNAERRVQALSSLARNAQLMQAAQIQADQMAAARTMAHDLPGAPYSTPSSRLAAVGYQMSATGENVAEGYPSAAAVVAGWMTSPGHRANILGAQFTEMGAGEATSSAGRHFYAQVFGRPR